MVLVPMYLLVLVAGTVALPPAPPTPATLPPLSFGAAFGDNMVLQMAPAAAAVYGYIGPGGTGVTVTVKKGGTVLYSVVATVNTTSQPFGKDFGIRPPGTYNPWDQRLATWKAILHPTVAGGDYSITATCVGCSSGPTATTIENATFGDMWYCSGQYACACVRACVRACALYRSCG